MTSEHLSKPEELPLADVVVRNIGTATGGATYSEAAEAMLMPVIEAARTAAAERLRSAAGEALSEAARKELDEEDEKEAARREAMVKAEAPRTDVVRLNYASAAELKPKLESMLSPKGRIEVDDRTNALIVNDVAGNRENIQRLALSLDLQTPQISIEARIVEARSTFLRQLGIQWGGRALMGPAGGNATGLLFPSSIGLQYSALALKFVGA